MHKKKRGKYIFVKLAKDHPSYHLVGKDGYAAEHRVIAETKIGRKLTKGEVVHHMDGNEVNNHPTNLLVLPDNGSHKKQHMGYTPVRVRNELYQELKAIADYENRSVVKQLDFILQEILINYNFK